jgi:hypothetical protein
MLWLKGCSRCAGDLQEESDKFGLYIVCIQCGYYLSDLEARLVRSGARPAIGRTPGFRFPVRMAS